MTYVTTTKNTRWQRDSTGHYIELDHLSDNMDVTINFENLLNTGEQLEEMSVNTDLTVAQYGPFWLDPVSKRLILALIQFGSLTTKGTYAVDFTVRTNQNRTYQKHFRVKVV